MSSISLRLYPRIERRVVAAGWFREEDPRRWRDFRRVVFVCTGNICRSPYAESIARKHGLVAVSCGVNTENGLPADPTAIIEAGRRNVDITSHRTTRWQDLEIQSGDIVVATELRHAMAIWRKAREKNCPVVLLSSLLRPKFEVLRDPYGRPQQEYARIFDLIDSSVACLARRVHGTHDEKEMQSAKGAVGRMKVATGRILKDLVGRVLVVCGMHKRLLHGKAIVVAFHSITAGKSGGALRCSVEDFERYCRFFARHMKTETLTRMVEQLEKGSPLHGELAITFDDGYADNVELALPILSRWSLRATFYVTTGFIQTQTQALWDTKANLRSRWMTWEQVRQLVNAGHELGAHTVTHINLATATAEQAESELRQSRDDIAAQAGIAPSHFAVPYGRAFPALDQTAAIARNLGFRSVSLCRGGIVPQGTRTTRIERWPINPSAYLSPYGWLADVLRDSNSPDNASGL
jgi:protein-tyrosine phosphatase